MTHYTQTTEQLFKQITSKDKGVITIQLDQPIREKDCIRFKITDRRYVNVWVESVNTTGIIGFQLVHFKVLSKRFN